MKSKFGKKMAVALLAVGIIAGSVATNVKAASTSDTSWDFKTFGNSGTNYTDTRSKTDISKAYVNVQVYNGRSGDYLQMYLVDSNYGDFTKHGRVVKTVSGPGQYSVTNWAFEERGAVPVRMAFYAPWRPTYSWAASGLWSPDSTGTYN